MTGKQNPTTKAEPKQNQGILCVKNKEYLFRGTLWFI